MGLPAKDFHITVGFKKVNECHTHKQPDGIIRLTHFSRQTSITGLKISQLLWDSDSKRSAFEGNGEYLFELCFISFCLGIPSSEVAATEKMAKKSVSIILTATNFLPQSQLIPQKLL